MRADAKKNHDHLLSVARDAILEQGADVSLRDIARRANVGLATLFRHFPTRVALLDALLQANLDALTKKAKHHARSDAAGDALAAWFRDGVTFTRTYGGVVESMAAALDDPDSALHASCSSVRSAGARLLELAQTAGKARADIDGTDLFALMGALAWTGNQPAFASRTEALSDLIVEAILTR